MKFFVLLGLGCVFEVLGDLSLKLWSVEKWGRGGLWGGLLLYAIGSGFWLLSLREKELGRAVAIFMVLNAIGAVGLGAVFLSEKITPTMVVGLVLGCASIVLLNLDS